MAGPPRCFAPDSITPLKTQGFQIVTGPYPHNWGHTLRLDKGPWDNKLLRKAANYAIDRVGICKNLLNDTCVPGTGVAYKGHPWFGNPKETYDYNPEKAKALIKQAGFGVRQLFPVVFRLLGEEVEHLRQTIHGQMLRDIELG